MMIKNQISLFAATFFIIGFFFLTLPEKGLGGTPLLGCCKDAAGCIGCGTLEVCAIRGFDCPGQPVTDFFPGEMCNTSGVDDCKTPDQNLGCCVISAGNCNDGEEIVDCDGLQGIAWFEVDNCSEVPQCAPIVTDVPTLSGWGLLSLAVVLGILGIAGFMVIRRRKATA
jgi:hypothetical protein